MPMAWSHGWKQGGAMPAGLTPLAPLQVLLLGARPMQDDSTPTAPSPEGVHLIHQIPSGIACVYDQVIRTVKQDQSFEELLFAEYQNVDVAQQLAQENDLVPNADGSMTIFVPTGDPVVIPDMCYPKSSASAVTLQSTGVPDESSDHTSAAGFLLIALAVGALVLGWRWVSARIVKVR